MSYHVRQQLDMIAVRMTENDIVDLLDLGLQRLEIGHRTILIATREIIIAARIIQKIEICAADQHG